MNVSLTQSLFFLFSLSPSPVSLMYMLVIKMLLHHTDQNCAAAAAAAYAARMAKLIMTAGSAIMSRRRPTDTNAFSSWLLRAAQHSSGSILHTCQPCQLSQVLSCHAPVYIYPTHQRANHPFLPPSYTSCSRAVLESRN